MSKRLQQFVVCFVAGMFWYMRVSAQFAGAVGSLNTTAVSADSTCFSFWASRCEFVRGCKNMQDTSLGYVTAGDSTSAIGKAGENGTLSLGDWGSAIVRFPLPIRNVDGFDFAVFENGLNDQYLELAYVEVSNDNKVYYRFPAHYVRKDTVQIGPFDAVQHAEEIDGLAGKYRALFGTPFDLSQLSGMFPELNAISSIRIVDVGGCMQSAFARTDSIGNKINDPWPTPFETGGFDLDAVGAIHQFTSGISEMTQNLLSIFPLPAIEQVHIHIETERIEDIQCINLQGKSISIESEPYGLNSVVLNINQLNPGMYWIKIQTDKQQLIKPIIKQ